MKHVKEFSCLTLFAVVILASCHKENKPAPATDDLTGCDVKNVTYLGTIKPIISMNCAKSGCHDAVTAAGGYAMDGYDGLLHAVQSGRLTGALDHAPGYSFMPVGGQLSKCDISKIKTWIGNGALNN